jgi:hypothetical protein
MPILQHYYTSFANRETGTAGFQVKAASTGISPDTQTLILRLIAYRIPPTLDERDIATHPTALRYYYENPQRCFLMCSQSNGTDDNGRPGNFFGHTLIASPESFKQAPPILYWHSNFWIKRDNSSRIVLDPLTAEDMEPALDIEQVWAFLSRGKRLSYFYRLMCAVVHARTSRRRIVIIDSAENVAMWVAAVSAMLPPDYRPLLSFATYHHDPYQAQFLITGTTSDSSFRASSEEYMSFFVLNTEIDRVSEVRDSFYAEAARQAAQSIDAYESLMLPLFALTTTDDYHQQRFPTPEYIDEQLDLIALYRNVISQDRPATLTEQDLQAVSVVLTSFEQFPKIAQEDIDELKILSSALAEVSDEGGPAAVAAYKRAVQLQKKFKIPTEKQLLKHLQKTIKLIKEDDRKTIPLLVERLLEIYGSDFFEETVNRPEFLSWLDRNFGQATAWQQALFWNSLGSYLHISRNSEQILLLTLATLGEAWNTRGRDAKNLEETGALYGWLFAAMKGREPELLRFAVAHNGTLPRDTIRHLYCRFIYPFDFDRRLPYREIVQPVVPDAAWQELRYQIRKTGRKDGLSHFEQWILQARRDRVPELPTLVDRGLDCLAGLYEQVPEEWYRLASRILTSKALQPLPQRWQDHLVEMALSRVSLGRYTPADLEMCEKYRNREGIAAERRVVMNGLLAMKYGTLDQDLSDQLLSYFVRLAKKAPEQGRQEMNSFVQQFMTHPLNRQTHNLMVNAAFEWSAPQNFWEPYWDALHDVMVGAGKGEQAVNILEYWFASPPDAFKMQFTPHYFFLHLPEKIAEWQKERGFSEARASMSKALNSRNTTWSTLALEYLLDQKNLFAAAGQNIAAVGQGLAARLRKSLDSKYASQQDERAQAEQRKREAFAASVSTLFPPGKIRKAHQKNLQSVYYWENRELFWECYWQQMIDLFLSQDAPATLDLLAFWFEDAYAATDARLCLAQAFFLGFTTMLDTAQRERNFAASARKINERGSKAIQQSAPWFALVEEYFQEPEQKGRFPFLGHRS